MKGEEPFRKAFDLGVVGMGTTDPHTYYWLSANKRLCDIVGYTEKELLKKTWVEMTLPKEKIEEDKAGVRKIIDGKINGYVMEKQYVHKDGHLIDITLSVQGVKKNDGTTDYMVVLIDDITGRKRMEEELLQSKNFLEGIFNGIQDGISVLDKNLKIIHVNHAMNNWYSHILPLQGKQCFHAYHGKSEPCTVCPTIRAIEKGTLQSDVVPFTGPHGRIGWQELFAFPLKDEKNNVTGVIEYVRDITEKKKIEEMLQEKNKALEYKNIALRETYYQVESEKKQIEHNVIVNVDNLLLPIIGKMKLKGESLKYINLLQKGLQELTSSFGLKLTEKKAKLSSREIDICNMIKNGLTSKEIADLLNISTRTAEKHRANIRKKLGIKNKEINLTSFLKTL